MFSSAIIILTNFMVTFTISLTPEYYENYLINEGQIRSFETPSIQNCIHKCQFDNQCNIANLKVITASKIQCVFARVECFEDLHEKMQESTGWYLYKLPEKYCKARLRSLEEDNVSASSTVASAGSGSPSNEKECSKGGGFKIQHVGSGKYLLYDQTEGRINLHFVEQLGDKFCVTDNGYLKQVALGKCLRKVKENGLDQISLNSDCSSNKANFVFREGKIYYQSQETVLVTPGYINIMTGTVCVDESLCRFQLVWS